jgi:hypothetical protein
MTEIERKRSRPHIPEYGLPEHEENLLPWSHIGEQMRPARNYWINTASPDGIPHARPVWGVWVDDTFFCGGGAKTRWQRNLAANPRATVHLESGDSVVILEGWMEVHTPENTDEALLIRIDDAYEEKYGMRHGTPVWELHVGRAFAWTNFGVDATRWHFK